MSDLAPLAGLAKLRQANLYMSENLSDVRALAFPPKLSEINLLGCKKLTDIAPLRAAAKRGAVILVPNPLLKQIPGLKTETDF